MRAHAEGCKEAFSTPVDLCACGGRDVVYDLTTDDKKRLTAIMDAIDPEQLARLIFDYYHDRDRADRTSRAQMYLHIGMLTGGVLRALEGSRPPIRPKARRP